MTFRFIHTGDLHIDSPLTGLRGLDDERANRIADAPRRAFSALVDKAISAQVDAVLIAGDLWDGDWKDISAGLFVAAEVRRLAEAGIRSVAVLGNHDAASLLSDRIRGIEGLTVLPADRPGSVDLGPALIHGQSYARPDVTTNLVKDYPIPDPARINVGLLHSALDGAEGHEPYAPCSLSELLAKRYDYFALGHVHTRAILANAAASEGGTAAYCGVLQGRHVREAGPKGAFLVEIAEIGARACVSPVDLPLVAWHRIEADVTATPGGEPLGAMRAALEDLRCALPTQLETAVVRLALTGETAQGAALKAQAAALREGALLAAEGSDPRFVVERVVVETRSPVTPAQVRLPHHFEALLAEAASDPAVELEAMDSVREILVHVPSSALRELKEAHPELAPVIDHMDGSDALKASAYELAAAIAVK